jgi:hypothetical protein
MKSRIFAVALASLTLGIAAGYSVANTRARFRADLLTANGAYLTLQQIRNDRPERAASMAESQLVWSLASLTRYPKWAWWNGNAEAGNHIVGEKVFDYIPAERIQSLAQTVGSNEQELRAFSSVLYPPKMK